MRSVRSEMLSIPCFHCLREADPLLMKYIHLKQLDPLTMVRFATRMKEPKLGLSFYSPGGKKSDLTLSLEGNQLKLSGKKTKGKEADGLFQANDLNLEVSLPEHLLTEKATAKLEEGVLKVIIPSVKQVAPKSIKIG